MKFSGKKRLMITLIVTKNPQFHPVSGRQIFGKITGRGGGGERRRSNLPPTRLLRVNKE